MSITLIDCKLSYRPNLKPIDSLHSLHSLLDNYIFSLLPSPGPEYTQSQLNVLNNAPVEFTRALVALSLIPDISLALETSEDNVLHVKALCAREAVGSLKGSLWIPLVNAWGVVNAKDTVNACLRALVAIQDHPRWNASVCGSHVLQIDDEVGHMKLSSQQLNTLAFMVKRERGELRDWVKCAEVSFSMASFRFATRPPRVENDRLGGFVCDPIGTGKTLSALALCTTVCGPTDKPTLIVCPRPLVEQWLFVAREKAPLLNAWANEPLSEGYPTSSSLFLRYIVMNDIHVVIASYDDVLRVPLFHAMDWHRVIFDESHTMQDSWESWESWESQEYLTPYRLRASRRWCLSHEPFKRDIDPQLQALGYLIWDQATIYSLMQVAASRTVAGSHVPVPRKVTNVVLNVPNDDDCAICLRPVSDPRTTPCGHCFCVKCITSSLEHNCSCPLCRSPIDKNALRTARTDLEKRAKLLLLHSIIKKQQVSKAVVVSEDVALLKMMKLYFESVNIRCPLASRTGCHGVGQFVQGTARVLALDATLCHMGLKLGEMSHVFFLDKLTESQRQGVLNMVLGKNVIALTLLYD
jgi:hypothetical protein